MSAASAPTEPVPGDALLPAVAAATADAVGEAFLHLLARTLGPALGARAVVVEEDDPVRRLAGWAAPGVAIDSGEAGGDELVVPLPGGGGEPLGRLTIVLGDLEPDDDARRALDVLAARAAAEVARLRQARLLRLRDEEIARARARVLQAADEERLRIGRDLHDGAQQRLVALGHLIDLGLRRLDAGDGDQVRTLLDRARGEASAALAELQELSRGLHPVGLAEHGLGPALEALARRGPLDVAALPDRRLPDAVEATAFFLISEAVSNAAKHAPGARVRAEVDDLGPSVVITVADDGPGGADPGTGSGLRGLRDRTASLGGSLEVVSPAGEGTTLRATIPLAAWRTAQEPFLEFGHHDDDGQGERSIEAVLSGQRRLSVGLLREWDLEGGPPRPGATLPVRDHHGRRHGAVEVQRVAVVAFGDLRDEVPDATAVGEEDLDVWLERQKSFYDGCRDEMAVLLGEPGWRLTDDEPMVVTWFAPTPAAAPGTGA